MYLFGVLRRFQHCTGHITTGSWKGRGNQYREFVRDLYCKLPTNDKQLPAFPLEAMLGTKPRPQRWEARVLPLCHRGPPTAPVHYSAVTLKNKKTVTEAKESSIYESQCTDLSASLYLPLDSSSCAFFTYSTATSSGFILLDASLWASSHRPALLYISMASLPRPASK